MNLITVCAPSGGLVDWHSIDWAKVHRNVRRLQARIVKAWKEGKHGRVKALQWLLTHSFSGRAIAVKRMTENRGRRTSGVDGEIWSTPQAKSKAMSSLKRRGYNPLPLRRIYIPKTNGKLRSLGIPTMRDRAMQTLYLLALQPIAETTADSNSYGFRPERSTADAREQCFTSLAQKVSAPWILEGDIRACFDEISQDWMVDNIPLDKTILGKWLKAGFMEQGRFFPTERGAAQGGPISPTLANMTLDGLEAELEAHFGQKGTLKKAKHKVNLCRFADDFVVTGVSKELLEHEVKPVIERFLSERSLELSAEKTRITHIDEGFDFLGWNFRKYNGTLLIKPNKKNVKAVLKKIREIVNGNKATRQECLIRQLNPVIRGWANYHRVAVAKRTFNSVDNQIWHLLWRWARRRHPKKGRKWTKDRYFKRKGHRNWVFATDQVELVKARDIKIRRHVKIQGNANPFDPDWESYFERRLRLQMKNDLKGRRTLLSLWKKQNGQCPNCRQPLKSKDVWEIHHIVSKAEGGKDNIANLQMLHLNCHRQIHSRNKSKPSRVPKGAFVEA